MTVARLRREMTAAEYVRWVAFDKVQAKLQKQAEKEAERRSRSRKR